MKNSKVMNIFVFILILSCLLISNLFSSDKKFSDNENRFLAQKPVFKLENFFNGSYMEDMEEYLNDQFVLRDYWVEGKTIIERLLGKTENNSVYFADDQYLIEKLAKVDWAKVEKNINVLKEFSSAHPEYDIKMTLIPSASQIYADKLPINNEIDQLGYIDLVEKELGSYLDFINVNELFLAHKHEDIYFKTDHHFNIYGAGLAYQALFGNIKEYEYKIMSDDFLGTLGSQSGAYFNEKDQIVQLICDNVIVTYPDSGLVDDNPYIEGNLNVKDQYTYYLNGNHTLVKIETQQKDKGKLLILRDSYANIFTPYLLEDYSEIYLVDMRYNKSSVSDFMSENDINELLVFYSAKNFMSENDILFLK